MNLNKSFISLEVLNLIDRTQVENNPNQNLFNTLVEFFNNLKNTNNYYSLYVNFIFNFIKIEGVQFPFDRCIKCGKEIKENYIYDFNFNGFVCDLHRTKDFFELNKNLYEKIIKINNDFDENIIFEKEELEIIFKMITSFLESHFSYRIKNYLNEILV